MNILIVHNSYQQPGGEDQVFEAEAQLLASHDHKVIRFQEHNDRVELQGALRLAANTIWNQSMYRRLRTVIRERNVDVMHVHNSFPLISPSCYYAAQREGVPVVQTLHNYRLLCPAASFSREGKLCEECLGSRFFVPAVRHACYRGNRQATAVTAAMLETHRVLGTWSRKVDAFIALTAFARNKFIEGGLPGDKIFVKPNFLASDPGAGLGTGGFALFAGRLTPEKGIRTLLEAWSGEMPLPLEIVGDGPLGVEVQRAADRNPNIRWRKWLPRDQVLERMRLAQFVVLPSTWYEGFPMIVVESFALGVPVIASRLGSLASLIEHRRTGLHFEPGNASSLAAQVRWLQANEDGRHSMSNHARRTYLSRYTGTQNYAELIEIYETVCKSRNTARLEQPLATTGVN